MLWTIFVVLLILWLLGFSLHVGGGGSPSSVTGIMGLWDFFRSNHRERGVMKTKVYIGAVLAGAMLFVVGHVTASGGGGLSQKTQENLSTAMHGEAFAYAKYLLYAKQAQRNGNAELANLFTQAAKTERFQHFAEEADLARLVGSDADNLKDAIKGESYEVDTMYRKFAEQAAATGDKAVADRFEEVRQDEMAHRDAFKIALMKVEKKLSGGQ